MKINDDDIHLKLLAGQSVEIDGIGEVTPLKLKEIIRIGENEYKHMLFNTFLFDKKNLTETNTEIEQYCDFEILLSLISFDNSFKDLFFNAFKTFIHKEPKLTNDGLIYVDELNNSGKTLFTEEKFEHVKKVLKIANFIYDDEEEYTAGNDRAKKFMDLLKKKKEQYKSIKKSNINLHSLISAVRWKLYGLDDNIFNLTIYELYDAHRRLESIDNYNFTLTGIYTGNVDDKKIDLSNINWANILKIK